MAVVEVVFGNLNDERELPLLYKIFDTPVAQRWLTYLELDLREKASIEIHDLLGHEVHGHFMGFPKTQRPLEDLSNLINKCIDTMNEYISEKVPLKAFSGMSQAHLNYLHEYFVSTRGPTRKPTEEYLSAPEHIKAAIERFNLYIHEFEDILTSRRLADDSSSARVAVLFMGKKRRYELFDEDYQHFKFDQKFGQITAHYCEVGKQLIDVYRDSDDILDVDSIQPMKLISSDFDLFFGESLNRSAIYRKERDFHQWLSDEGYNPRQENLSLGKLYLGQLILDRRFSKMNQKQFVEQMHEFWSIKDIIVHR